MMLCRHCRPRALHPSHLGTWYTFWTAWTLGPKSACQQCRQFRHRVTVLCRQRVDIRKPASLSLLLRVWFSYFAPVGAENTKTQKSIRGLGTWARFSFLKLPHCGRQSRQPFSALALENFCLILLEAGCKNPYSLKSLSVGPAGLLLVSGSRKLTVA